MNTLLGEQRLSNIICFFAQNTEQCGKIKLFKLLYLLDFQHVRETGKPVTGLDYQAWKFGPVPVKLMESWDDPEAPLAEGCRVEPELIHDYTRQTVKIEPGFDFKEELFSRREIRIMRALAERYRQTASPTMIDVTHQENGAWDKVWQGGKGRFEPIPYGLAIPEEDPSANTLHEIHGEYQSRKAAVEAYLSSQE